MAPRRRSLLKKDPVTGRWVLEALRATDETYLGGLTLPALTKRPHMGPFNRVTDYKISDADEVYRQHDIGYGELSKRGVNPYTTFNKYDQALLDAPSLGWADYVAKGVFGLKKFFTYGMPELRKPSFRPVNAVSASDNEVVDGGPRYDRRGPWINYDTRSRARRGPWINYDTTVTSVPSDRGIFSRKIYYRNY